MNNISDSDLIRKARGGDDEALGIFLDRHRQALKKYLAAECGNWNIADDLTQETEIKFWRNFRKIKKDESARTYLFRIGHRNFLDWQRKETRRRNLVEIVPILTAEEMEKYPGQGVCEDDI